MVCLVCYEFFGGAVFVCLCLFNVFVCFRRDIVCDAARFDFVCVLFVCLCASCVVLFMCVVLVKD